MGIYNLILTVTLLLIPKKKNLEHLEELKISNTYCVQVGCMEDKIKTLYNILLEMLCRKVQTDYKTKHKML